MEEKTINPHPVYSDYGADYKGNIYSFKLNKVTPIIPLNHGRGYNQFGISFGKHGRKNYLIHRFVWECFNGIIPDEMHIHHIDHIKTNNKLENLKLVTHWENMQYGKEAGVLYGAASPNYKR